MTSHSLALMRLVTCAQDTRAKPIPNTLLENIPAGSEQAHGFTRKRSSETETYSYSPNGQLPGGCRPRDDMPGQCHCLLLPSGPASGEKTSSLESLGCLLSAFSSGVSRGGAWAGPGRVREQQGGPCFPAGSTIWFSLNSPLCPPTTFFFNYDKRG